MNSSNNHSTDASNNNVKNEAHQRAFTLTATYSVEDNKLRLYALERLDDETYNQVKMAGFKWAPKQQLFVAPSWSPAREDLCLSLAGEIMPEQTTLVERAQAKSERLDGLSEKRAIESNAFHAVANAISERFAYGQPILVGHHSERKARKDQERMQSNMERSVSASKASTYWAYRAEGVERHAIRKANPGVRSRRIKTLLAELRDLQRDINHGFMVMELWQIVAKIQDEAKKAEMALYWSGAQLQNGPACPYYNGTSIYSSLSNGTMTTQTAIDTAIEYGQNLANSKTKLRWIEHILNRLAYERSELGYVKMFEGELTKTILQAFLREHGAYKPKVVKTEKGWRACSDVPLPLHISDGKELELEAGLWCSLMQQLGYEVPAPKAKLPPILNFKAGAVKGQLWSSIHELQQVEITKAEYSAIYSDYRGVALSECGSFRFKICKDPKNPSFRADWFAVFLIDSKEHPAPQSDAIVK